MVVSSVTSLLADSVLGVCVTSVGIVICCTTLNLSERGLRNSPVCPPPEGGGTFVTPSVKRDPSIQPDRYVIMHLKTLGTVNSKNSLIVFDEFEVDYTLPKHRVTPGDEDNDTSFVSTRNRRSTFVTNPMWTTANGMIGTILTGVAASDPPGSAARVPWWKRLCARKPAPAAPAALVPEESVLSVFARIKLEANALTTLHLRQDELTSMLAQAEKAGQRDLITKIQTEWGRLQTENALYAAGVRKCLTEQQLLIFVDNCEKGLCLDWVRNFIRVIPPEALEAKVKCDTALLFDNYCILHYDPDQTATTEKARADDTAKRRDPILFGMLKDVRKLYFVADWIDDTCNLTFEDVAKKLVDVSHTLPVRVAKTLVGESLALPANVKDGL